MSQLIVPDSIHAKAGFRNPTPSHPGQEFVLPSINFQPTLLVISNGHPLIRPVARRNSIAVPAARRRGIQADLTLNGAAVGQLEGRDVAREVEAVRARRGEQIASRVRQGAHVGAVLGPAVGDAWRDEGVAAVGVDGHPGGRVDEVLAYAVAVLHEGIEVVPSRVHGDPARVVPLVRAVDTSDELDLGGVGLPLPVNPELVGLEVGRVEVRARWVEDHAVDSRVVLVGVVLHVGLEGAGGGGGGEDGTVAGVGVEGVAVDTVGGLIGGEEEYGPGVCLGGGG